jgi:hypothetical protein
MGLPFMTTHTEQIYTELPAGTEQPAKQTHGEPRSRGRRRRRRRTTPRRKNITPGRVAKFVVFGVLALVALMLYAAEFLRSAKQEDHKSAEQEQACSKAYKSGDVRLAAVACEPANWQRPN